MHINQRTAGMSVETTLKYFVDECMNPVLTHYMTGPWLVSYRMMTELLLLVYIFHVMPALLDRKLFCLLLCTGITKLGGTPRLHKSFLKANCHKPAKLLIALFCSINSHFIYQFI